MNAKKIVTGCTAVICIAALLTVTAVTGTQMGAGQYVDNTEATATAGVATVMNDYDTALSTEYDLWVSVVREDTELLAASYESSDSLLVDMDALEMSEDDADVAEEDMDADDVPDDTATEEEIAATTESADEAVQTDADEDSAGSSDDTSAQTDGQSAAQADMEDDTAAEPTMTEEEQEWQNYLMANVTSSLNIRESASESAKVVGRMYKGDVAVIEGTEGEWTKITSGNVTGYVKTEYCLIGSDALAYAKENCKLVATVTSDKKLRIRTGQSTDSDVVTMVASGTQLLVDTEAETDDDWVAVIYGGKTCYVAAEFVKVSYQTGTAINTATEAAAAAAVKAASSAASASSSSDGSKSSSAATTDTDDVTLLAAIIICEAGNQSYECQVAVGAVVMNRVKSSSFPNTISKVIYQSGQFSPVKNGALAKRLKSGVNNTAVKAAKAAMAGEDPTNGCLFFNMTSAGHSGLVMGGVTFW